jgi:DNA polymerase III epsilon subunit-like protein
MKVLIFDTETTGLPEGRNPSIISTDKWPHIMQLSYLYIDTSNNCIIEKVDKIIKIPNNVVITQGSLDIHGITRERSLAEGIDIQEALRKFNYYLRECNVVIGHNISFDKRMIMVECIRNKVYHNFTMNNIRKPEYCTMKNSIELCKIPFANSKRQDEDASSNRVISYKFPKLIELYTHLFGIEEKPANLHNAMVDVLICARAYIKMTKDVDIMETNQDFRVLFDSYQ